MEVRGGGRDANPRLRRGAAGGGKGGGALLGRCGGVKGI